MCSCSRSVPGSAKFLFVSKELDAESAKETELHRAARYAVVVALYFAAGKAGLQFASVNSSVTAIWPPTGIALAALTLFGLGMWPAILLGAFLVNISTAGTTLTSIGIACGNTLEAVVGAYLVSRYAGGKQVFRSAQSVFRFATIAGLCATPISATIGVSSLVLGGLADWTSSWTLWATWWLGDTTGAIIVTPLALLWYGTSSVKLWNSPQRAEAILMFGTIIATGLWFYTGATPNDFPLGFLCLPGVVWAAFRFGQREAVTGVAFLNIIGMYATLHGVGPWVRLQNNAMLVLESYMATISLVMLTMAALVDTQRQLNESDRSAREDAESANRAKDEFLAMLSHELRNPLAAITTATSVLRESPKTDASSRHAVDVLSRQTRHLAHLVNDLLDVSRVTSGKLTLSRELVELSVVVARAVESCKPLIDSRSHKLELDLDEDPIWVNGDLTRLSQVMLNLLTNAAKYTPMGGTISVQLRRENGLAVLSVRDSGEGIPPHLLPRIFDLFVQGARTLDRSEGGMGLGLTVAQRLVHMHDGTIEARSAGAGQGSEFIVKLPLSTQQPFPARVAGHATEQMYPKGPPRRVLVVDDNADTADSLATLLRRDGNEVRVAYDGPSALELATEYKPDVGLLDIGLPGMSGYELARELRKIDGENPMLLIAITGYGREEDFRESRQAGFDRHLVKPVSFERVEQLLTALPSAPSAVS